MPRTFRKRARTTIRRRKRRGVKVAVKRLKQVVSIAEPKEIIGATINTPVSTAILLTPMTQGVDSLQRIGDKISVIDSTVRMVAESVSNVNLNFYRAIVFRFDGIQAQAATLAWSDFFFPNSVFGNLTITTPGNIYGPKYVSRFNKMIRIDGALQVLYDSGPQVITAFTPTTSTRPVFLKTWRSKRKYNVQYTTPNPNDASKGALYFMHMCTDLTALMTVYNRHVVLDS